MAFVRVKKIKGIEYGYLVENSWKGVSTQRVKKYLGRIHSFEKKQQIGFREFAKIESLNEYIMESDVWEIVLDLIRWELFRHEIPNDAFMIGVRRPRVQRNKKNVCIRMNEGFLCGYTLSRILRFEAETDEDGDVVNPEQAGAALARCFVDAGIGIEHDVFISYFAKVVDV